MELALETVSKIDFEYMETLEKLTKIFKPTRYIKREHVPKYNKDGTLSKVSERIIKEIELVEYKQCKKTGKYTEYAYKEFNINSPADIVKRLKNFWHPIEFTPKGTPKVSEANLNTIKDSAPEDIKLIKKCKVLASRGTLIRSFIKATGEDGRVHGYVKTIGTASGRMSHSNPNTGNIPSKGLYGSVCREMFIAGEGRKIVGCDAAGIQLRGLAHYLQDDTLVEQILEGDIHVYLAQNIYELIPMDEPEPEKHKGRKTGKTCTYSILMGAGKGKIGALAGGDFSRGNQIFNQMAERLHGWSEFKQHIEKCARIKGYMVAIDGRRIPLKSAHYGMSTFLQSYETIIMKRAMVETYKKLSKMFVDVRDSIGRVSLADLNWQVAVVHDEFQWDCREEDAKTVGQVIKESIIEAAEYFKSYCPMDGEFMIGDSWKETH